MTAIVAPTVPSICFFESAALPFRGMKSVRIGAGLGFYGDSWRPVRASIESGGVQYIASDHLAELTLAMTKMRARRTPSPSAGTSRRLSPGPPRRPPNS